MILDPLIMRALYSRVSYANHLQLGNKLLCFSSKLLWFPSNLAAFVFVNNPVLNGENKYSNNKAKANVTTSDYFHVDLILIDECLV